MVCFKDFTLRLTRLVMLGGVGGEKGLTLALLRAWVCGQRLRVPETWD